MTQSTKTILLREIKNLKAMLDNDTCKLTDGEAMKLIASIAHEPMTKQELAKYLNLPIGVINNHINKGYIPKGRKRMGKEELFWFRDEINDYLMNYNY